MSNELVLVTGGTGYVASRCVAELLRRGYDVRTTVRTAAKEQAVRDAVATEMGSAATEADPAATEADPAATEADTLVTKADAGVTEAGAGAAEADAGATETASVAAETASGDRLSFAHADLTRDEGWKAAMDGVDFVLHVASPLGLSGAGPQALIDTARGGTLRVLQAAADSGVRRVVMTSAANTASPSSYAEDGITDETLWTDPDDPTLIPYRRSKTVAERAAWDFAAAHPTGPELTTVLPGAVFGPIMSTTTLGSVGIIAAMLNGQMPGIPRVGLEVVDVRDLADAHILAMTTPEAAGERFLATGDFMWMADIAQTLRDGLGEAAANVATLELDDEIVRQAAEQDTSLQEILPGLGRRSRHSIDKAGRVLGWHPRPGREAVLDCAHSLIAHGVA
ncbi:NAD-dependent epimerase/dehydratase family protein [Actinomadura barringtoniae]|uniref:NAD-dependent epimerase/dehydratase family protein n=1 Tax=Actinomadura barringtoniae TaxID=1427535 RepID=A0A939PNX0_9ACTN|nr:NAD-dependent epimerase/dehydratase family protein [Actinomadura barringtoniae]MBO2455822.1 NAD-dependent epimerase/dehydratase family protein [Actinomadura barringtoniae]